MPVFGLIDGNVVSGQIVRCEAFLVSYRPTLIPAQDNIMLRESQHVAPDTQRQVASELSQKKCKATAALQAESAKRARLSPDAADKAPCSLPAELQAEDDDDARATRYTIHLSDTKTRTTPDLPPEEDSVSHHLQLMLYHRLLSGLLAKIEATGPTNARPGDERRVQPLDFTELWRRLSLNPQRPFSSAFIRGARGLLEGRTGAGCGDIAFECLDDLVKLWRKAVKDLSIDGVDDTLTLEYSLQTPAGAGDGSTGGASQPGPPNEEPTDNGGSSQESGVTLVGISQNSDATEVADEDPDDTAVSRNDALPNGLLGVKRFQVDGQKLDAHLRNILRWWHGQRRPRGVRKGMERRCE